MTTQSPSTKWHPPDGLGYSSLRPIRLTTSGVVVAAAGLVFLLAGPVLGYVIDRQIQRGQQHEALLIQQGVETTAVIARVWRSGGEDDSHMVSYRFNAGDREWTGQVAAPRRIWAGLRRGAALPIRYVPSQPRINHPTAWPSTHAPYWLPWLIPIVLALPAILLWSLIRRQQRLLCEGRPAPGVITRLKRTDKQVVAYYDFTLLSGKVVKGKCSGGRRTPAVGSQVCVLYSPDNPRRNAVYPLQFVKLERS